ncbi:MAG: alanine dehydrogenase, partial [Flavobacteriales bacterium]
MKIGIIKEGKTPPDKRVGLIPSHCAHLKQTYPDLEIRVQRSPIRCFQDEEYATAGIELVDNVNDCDVIFGVKEVKHQMLADGKTMLFFSHTIKKQPYNRELLQEVLKRKIRLIDYETLTYPNRARVLGFGRYAGIVGAYNALIAHGKRHNSFELKPAFQCEDMKEMGREMEKV